MHSMRERWIGLLCQVDFSDHCNCFPPKNSCINCVFHVNYPLMIFKLQYLERCSCSSGRTLRQSSNMHIKLYCIILLAGQPKPKTVDQPILVDEVGRFVRQFLPTFPNDDIIYVRSMRSAKIGIYNVQCQNAAIATLVKSSFANLVKSDDPPDYVGDVSISFSHSLGTRVRLSIMKSICKRQREHDPKAICTVTSFTTRPMIRY